MNLKKPNDMYLDKDKSGKISIMEILEEEAKDIGAILFEFEHLVEKGSMPDSEKGRLSMVSVKLRFKLIDVLNEFYKK